MNYEIVELEDMLVQGVMVKTSNMDGSAMVEIPKLWASFFNSVYFNIQNKVNNKTIGLYTDFEGDYTKPYNFVVGTQVSNDFNELVTKVIKAGKYAKFVVKGDIQKDVALFWTKLWEMNLDRKYSTDFEEYQNLTDDMSNQEIHIYISIN